MYNGFEESFDLFIAYYGSQPAGSQSAAEEIYRTVCNADIPIGRKVRAYFHPAVSGHGCFEKTPRIVARTPMFLIVVDKNIPKNSWGQLIERRPDGSLSNLYEEVRAFHDSPMYKERGGDEAAKIYIADDLNVKEAEKLDPMFSGKTALRTHGEIIDWITHFYTCTYVDRIYGRCRYLLEARQDEFLSGGWVDEAEDLWRRMRPQSLGRLLLIYYFRRDEMAQGKDNAVRARLRGLCDELWRAPALEPNTREILELIRRNNNF